MIKLIQAVLVQKLNDEDLGTAFFLSFHTADDMAWDQKAQMLPHTVSKNGVGGLELLNCAVSG